MDTNYWYAELKAKIVKRRRQYITYPLSHFIILQRKFEKNALKSPHDAPQYLKLKIF